MYICEIKYLNTYLASSAGMNYYETTNHKH
jgi:hypothetical protein